MLHRGLDFHTVRVRCKRCGWFRNIAHSGCADGKRALVWITQSPDPSHILFAKVVEVAESIPLDEALRANPNYRDLVAEAHERGLFKMEADFDPLVSDRACPRCKHVGQLGVAQLLEGGTDVRY